MATTQTQTQIEDLKRRIKPIASKPATTIARQLQNNDPDTVTQIMDILWPHGPPETVSKPEWWQTPLGRQIARTGHYRPDGSVTHATAAQMLGVKRGTVTTLAERGTLTRHPDGGVPTAEIIDRLARLSAKKVTRHMLTFELLIHGLLAVLALNVAVVAVLYWTGRQR